MKLTKLFLLCLLITALAACKSKTSDAKKDDTANPENTTVDNKTDGTTKPIATTPDKPNSNNSTDEPPTDAATPGAGEFSGITLSKASYMSADENRMVDEINLIRTNPPAYVKFVNDYITQMEKDKADGIGFSNVDEEIATARELIAELKRTPKLSFLKPKQAIYNAAVKHGKEGAAKGSLDHEGSDGKWPWDRVKAAAPECSNGNENLAGGSSDVRLTVMMLLVDSGIPGRGHRKTLLNPDWTYAACYSVGQVGQMPNYWIQKFGKCD